MKAKEEESVEGKRINLADRWRRPNNFESGRKNTAQ